MKMLKVIIILILIAGVSFFVAKYFWIRVPTDTKIDCEDVICGPSEEYKDK